MTIVDEPRTSRDVRAVLKDLTPDDEVRGGSSSALHLHDPPLPIPPPGFVVSDGGDGAEDC